MTYTTRQLDQLDTFYVRQRKRYMQRARHARQEAGAPSVSAARHEQLIERMYRALNCARSFSRAVSRRGV